MTKIKIFCSASSEVLEKSANKFLKELHKKEKELLDIKFSTSLTSNSDRVFGYTDVLILYDDNQS